MVDSARVDTWVRLALMVAGASLVLTFAAIYIRPEGPARLRWPHLLLFLGVGISAYGSAGLKRSDWGWWGYALWVALLAVAMVVGSMIQRGRQRRTSSAGRPADGQPR